MKYIYPATFTHESDGGYSVVFNDLESCYTCGDTLEEAMDMAKDVLELVLYGYEVDNKPIPKASPIQSIVTDDQSFVTLIQADTLRYRKEFSQKAVKKTLTIPEWLNEAALQANINFSNVLQEALKQKLNIS